ncbi:MAG: metallophosphoesterase family protein [Mogibacterium sp.]|nr:metallophosphoesterase family protein [Mogibacterium sp.]
MKILLISDTEERSLWDDWTGATAEWLADVGLVLSAGDLKSEYLEFLVTMLNVPLVYVRGNHDGMYDEKPPEGCEDADCKVVEVECGNGSSRQKIRILGFGGSMRYKDEASDMYTEREMAARIKRAEKAIRRRSMIEKAMSFIKPDAKGAGEKKAAFDILLTHAPCRSYGDMEDLPHKGFECFNELLNKYSPQLHCYGHVHREYGMIKRSIQHPSGTLLINGSGHRIIDFGTP